MQTIVKRLFSTSQKFIDLELKYGCHNYAPLHVAIDRAEGIYMWDCEGKAYFIQEKNILIVYLHIQQSIRVIATLEYLKPLSNRQNI